MRIAFVGGTGPVGQASVPYLLDAGHDVVVGHSGAHEALPQVEHLHGSREEVLAAIERWAPDVLVDTFAGGATAAKAEQLAAVGSRCGVQQVVAVSSMDVYRHCANAGVDDHEPATLPVDALPLREDAPQRGTTGRPHDNVAMEAALGGAPRITILRPGAIYGPHIHRHVLREWYLVGRVARGERGLPLPDGGTQLFHRVALDRVGRAVAAAVERAPEGRFAVNVGDPQDLTFGGLAALVAEQLGHTWEPEPVPSHEGDHPWNVRHPVFVDTTRLRHALHVQAPDPREATIAQIAWLWEHRRELAAQA